MRATTTIAILAHVAIPTQRLETWRPSLLPKAAVEIATSFIRATKLPAMFGTIVIDMIQSQKWFARLAAAGADHAVMCQRFAAQSSDVAPHCLLVTPALSSQAGRAPIRPIDAGADAARTAKSLLTALRPAFLLALAAGHAKAVWAVRLVAAQTAKSLGYPLLVRGHA